MVPIILYIIWLILIIVIVVFSVLTAVNRSNEVETASYPANWCYADWMCGESTSTGKVESPLIELIPTMYACRSENFTFEMVDDEKVTCACPIQYVEKYDTGGNLNKTGIDRFRIHPKVTPSDPSLYICDNVTAGQKVLDKDAYTVSTLNGTSGGPCRVETCETLWAANVFTNKVARNTIGQVKPGPSFDAKWPRPSETLGVTRERATPEPWKSVIVGNYPNMPLHNADKILGQLERT